MYDCLATRDMECRVCRECEILSGFTTLSREEKEKMLYTARVDYVKQENGYVTAGFIVDKLYVVNEYFTEDIKEMEHIFFIINVPETKLNWQYAECLIQPIWKDLGYSKVFGNARPYNFAGKEELMILLERMFNCLLSDNKVSC